MTRVLRFALLTLLASMFATPNLRADAPAQTEEFATMRDGTRLAANVYMPAGKGPWPVIVTRTPYLKDRMYADPKGAMRYTAAGYVFIVQDVRGKGRSEGEYRAFLEDRLDGFDTVEWAAKQPFSNGKVGITGASAMGITANLAASANPPSLEAAYVVVAPQSRFYESNYPGGVFKEADVGNWMKAQGSADQVAGVRARVVWDDVWATTDFLPFINEVHVPMYNVGGWYDIFSVGNVRNFVYLQNRGADGARGNQKLLMGPFGHGALKGDLVYPDGGGISTAFGDTEIRWFNHWLKGEDNGVMREPPVRYYMMSAAKSDAASSMNGWRTAGAWPPPAEPARYYLTNDRTLSRSPPAAAVEPISYRFDPANPVPTVGGNNLTLPLGPMDQRAIGERADYLRFSTPPLAAPLAIAGPVTFEFWGATDGVDTDFMAKLVDVYPDGYEAIVLDAPLRTRYRAGRRPQDVKMMEPGKPVELHIDLWETALTFEAGHRIALHVTSSNHPRFEVNPNNGNAPGDDTRPPRVATNSIYLDREHPSALVLPVLVP